MANARRWRCWLLAVLPLLATCRQVAGIDDRTLGPVACGIEFPKRCETCAAQHCCAEIGRCAESPGCAELEGCLAACDGALRCRAQCAVDIPLERDAASTDLQACLAGHCEAPCGLSCGGLYQLSQPENANECQTCLARNYCADTRACAGNAQCQSYVDCRANCATGDCVGSCAALGSTDVEYCVSKRDCKNATCLRPCGSEFDTVVHLSSNLFVAIGEQQCQRQCSWGRNWSCLGRRVQPLSKTTTRALSVAFYVHTNTDAKSGIAVKMCRNTDLRCDENPVSMGTTDENGLVRLVDNATEYGTGFGLDGYLDVTAEGTHPTRVYWGFNLVEANGAFGVPLPLFTLPTLAALFENFDPALAAVGVTVVDCLGVQAPDVVVSLVDKAGQTFDPYYLSGGFPVTGPAGTDGSGSVFFVNVPPGRATLVARPNGAGLDASRIDLDLHAGTLTEVNLEPDQH